MKKLTIALTCTLLAAALCACTPAQSDAPAESTTPTPLPEDILNDPVATPDDGMVDPGMAVPPADDVAAEIPEADADLAALVEQVYAIYPVEVMMPTTTGVNLTDASWASYLTGLSEEQLGLADAAVVSESMTGSQAYSFVAVRAKNAADAPALAEAMLDGIDPAKWVCVMADELRAVAYDDLAVLVMADSEITDVDAVVDALGQVWGGEFSYEGTKTDTMVTG